MADNSYDFFNPDVAGVPIPDMNVTRPISPPKPNLAGEYIGQGLGTALKDTGEIIKDAQKLTDYTNKEELTNRIHSSVDPERDVFTASQRAQGIAQETSGAYAAGDPSDVTNAVNAAAGKADPNAPNAPTGLSDIQKKVSNAKAMKEQGTQSEMYFRGRINQLSKEYRQAYPQYRDYIDHIFSKAGFGNPANEYLSSIQRHNAALTAAASGGNDKDEDKAINHLYTNGADIDAYYGNGASAKMYEYLKTGKTTPVGIMAQVNPVLAAKATQAAKLTQAATADKNQAESFTRYAEDDTAQRAGLSMQSPDMQPIIERWSAPPGTIPPEQLKIDAQTVRQKMDVIRQAVKAEHSRQVPEGTVDQFGRASPTGKLVSPMAMAGAQYGPAVDRGLSDLDAIQKALDGGNVPQAKLLAELSQSKLDQAQYRVLHSGVFGDTVAIGNSLDRLAPQWASQFYTDVAVKSGINIPNNLRGLLYATTAGMASGQPFQAMVSAMDTIGTSNGDLNHVAWQVGVRGMQTAPQGEVRDGFIRSLYSSSPSIGDSVKSASDRKDFTGRFAAMTSEDSVRAIKTAEPQVQRQAESWIFHEGSNRIAAPLLQTLNKLEAEQGKTVASQYKIHYNTDTQDFGVDAFGFHNIRTSDFARIAQSPSVAPLRSAVANVLQNVIDPLNVVTHGYGNLLKGQTPEHINGFILSEMRKAGYTGE